MRLDGKDYCPPVRRLACGVSSGSVVSGSDILVSGCALPRSPPSIDQSILPAGGVSVDLVRRGGWSSILSSPTRLLDPV